MSRYVSVTLWLPMMLTLLTLLGLTRYSSDFHNWLSLLLKRVSSSGVKWTTKYMKTCTLVIIGVINGQPYTHVKGEPYVARARDGLPRSIPLKLRKAILASLDSGSANVNVLRAVLTVLAYQRSLRVGAPAKLSTITDPYKGTMSTFGLVPELLVVTG